MADAVKFIYNNAPKYGIDRNRIGLAGQSGGSSLALNGSLILANAGLAYMIKALFLCCPMIGMPYEDLPDSEYAQWERDLYSREHSKAFFKMGSYDFEFDTKWQ